MNIHGVFQTTIEANDLEEAMGIARTMTVKDFITFEQEVDYEGRLSGVLEKWSNLKP